MNSKNIKKSNQLEMSFGKANHQLRKKIMFQLVQQANRDNCYRCSKKILHIDNFSVEHKKPWLDSNNSIKLFFDLDNIAFSHMKCNIGARRIDKEVSRRNGKKSAIISPQGFAWCGKCKKHLPIENFSKNKRNRSNCEWICKKCRSEFRSN